MVFGFSNSSRQLCALSVNSLCKYSKNIHITSNTRNYTNILHKNNIYHAQFSTRRVINHTRNNNIINNSCNYYISRNALLVNSRTFRTSALKLSNSASSAGSTNVPKGVC